MQTKNTKKSLEFAIALMISLISATSADAQDIWMREHTAAYNTVWAKKLDRGIAFLSDTLCQGRATGSAGAVDASIWVMKQFEKSGLLRLSGTYIKHAYTGKGKVAHNVVGMLPGSVKNPCSRYIIVGAHYDHIGKLGGQIYPGADANASGTVAMATLAEMFTATKIMGRSYSSNIIFVAFDAKELDMAGSEGLWRMIETGDLRDPLTDKVIRPEDIRLMVNIDQIGCSLSPIHRDRSDYMIMLGEHSLPRSMKGVLEICNRFYDINMDIGLSYYGSDNFTKIFYRISDQKVFVDHGIPAVMFTSGITMNNNKTRDTADTIDYDILKKRIILIYHWLEKIL